MAVFRIGNVDGIKKILTILNTQSDDSFIDKEWDYASARIASIYREAERSLPVDEAADPNLWNLAEHLACYLIVKRMSHSLEGKIAADKDIKDATDQVWLHIGVQPGSPADSSDPVAIVGPRMVNVSGSGDDFAD